MLTTYATHPSLFGLLADCELVFSTRGCGHRGNGGKEWRLEIHGGTVTIQERVQGQYNAQQRRERKAKGQRCNIKKQAEVTTTTAIDMMLHIPKLHWARGMGTVGTTTQLQGLGAKRTCPTKEYSQSIPLRAIVLHHRHHLMIFVHLLIACRRSQ